MPERMDRTVMLGDVVVFVGDDEYSSRSCVIDVADRAGLEVEVAFNIEPLPGSPPKKSVRVYVRFRVTDLLASILA